MKKRFITSAVYVVVLAGLIALKWLVGGYGAIGFDALFTAISVIGTFEFLRAVNCVSRGQKVVAYVYAVLLVPCYACACYLSDAGVIGIANFPAAVAAVISGAAFIAASLVLVFDFTRTDLKSTAFCFFTMLYCGVLPLALSAVNHLGSNSLFAVIFLFLEAMLTDSLAFVFGVLLHKKFPKKMSPHVSPNKTIVGGIGGIVGGVLGAVAAYYLFLLLGGEIVYAGGFPLIAALIIISVPLAVIIQSGDLFESAIKRVCGIKDMGNILPGHGGVLDRFDSMLFSAPVVLFAFAIIAII